MTLTEAEIAELLPHFQWWARQFARYFPVYQLSRADFIQLGFLGTLQVASRASETAQDLLHRRIAAGKNKMIDAMRAFEDQRWQNGRKREVSISHIAGVMDRAMCDHTFEDRVIFAYDFRRHLARLPQFVEQLIPREQSILWARLQGKTLLAVAEEMNLTEGRISQIEKRIVTKLREEYREAA
jgi:RNA polymerase sigma factor (sigma-70 family)